MFEQVPPLEKRSGCETVTEAHLVFEPTSGMLVYADEAATQLFELSADTLETTLASSLLPEFANLAPRGFTVRRAVPGRDSVELAVRLERLRTSAFARLGAILAVVRVVPRGSEALVLAAAPRERRLESLWSLVVRRGLAGPEQVRAILREALVGIGLESATVGRVDGDEVVVEFADRDEAGDARVPLARSLARAALDGAGTYAVLDAQREPALVAAAGDTRCFLCAAFRVGDDRWVLTFASAQPRERPFEAGDWSYIEHVVEALARAIERRENDARIERLAYSDSLTALPNRAALLMRLDEAIDEARRIEARAAVLFLDVDGFKGVNDTVGHRGGDSVLAEIAQRLRGTLRREEYIGRLGGDEFAVVLPHVTDRDELEAIAQRIGGVLQYPFAVDDYKFSLSASIGVAIYPEDALGREDLLACADAAMYAAKEDGGSRVRFRDTTGSFAENALATTELTAEPREVGYLLCYQPILDVASGRVTAAEALIRRIHPLHGLLAPERGWSIARDEAGRRALDRWVLREATTQARAWQVAGTPIRVDVNLAAYDPREIDALLDDPAGGPDVRRLRVELGAEHFASEDGAALAAFVAHCAANGITFALDGFDGGLGALSSLAHLPIEAVKLERPLVESVGASRTTRAVVEGTIIVARSLGWQVIAKGVETASQQEALVTLGCDGIQGFHVAHPMTAPDFGVWLRERRFAHQA